MAKKKKTTIVKIEKPEEVKDVLEEQPHTESMIPEPLPEPPKKLTLKEETNLRKQKEKEAELSEDDRIAMEREIRRYVRKAGGYRKGLPESEKAKCAKLLIKLGRSKSISWDETIILPGIDKPTVTGMVFGDK